MDRELIRMQELADAISNVRLSRCSSPGERPEPDNDTLLLTGLMLVLLSDRADMMSIMMLLYILMGS